MTTPTFRHPHDTHVEDREHGLKIATMPLTFRDGELAIVVGWSDDDASYVAQFEQNDTTGAIGVGPTQTDALAQLAFALRAEVDAWRNVPSPKEKP